MAKKTTTKKDCPDEIKGKRTRRNYGSSKSSKKTGFGKTKKISTKQMENFDDDEAKTVKKGRTVVSKKALKKSEKKKQTLNVNDLDNWNQQ